MQTDSFHVADIPNGVSRRQILVIGATGTIGAYLYKHLDRSKFSVYGTFSQNAVANLMQFDLANQRLKSLPLKLQKGDWALLCAGMTNIDACKRHPTLSNSINATGTIRLIDDLLALGINILFFSSDYVFSGKKGNYSEDDAPDPITTYGTQKLEVETFIRESGGPVTVLRLSRILTTDPCDNSMLAEWVRSIASRRTIRCAADQFFSPTFVEDVVRGVHIVIMEQLHGLFHFCLPGRLNRSALLRQFLSVAQVQYDAIEEVNSSSFHFADNRSRDTSLNSAKFKQTTGFVFTPLAAGFALFEQARAFLQQSRLIGLSGEAYNSPQTTA